MVITTANRCTHKVADKGDWGVVASCKGFGWKQPECIGATAGAAGGAVTSSLCVFNPVTIGAVTAGTKWWNQYGYILKIRGAPWGGENVSDQRSSSSMSRQTCETYCDTSEVPRACTAYIYSGAMC